MTKYHHVRPALTAIAAVLALSSTPLAAQETVPEADTSLTAATPAAEPVATPVETPAADPLAPAEAETAPAAAPVARSTATRSSRAATRTAAPARTAPARAAPVAAAPAATTAESVTRVEPLVAPTPEALAAAPMTPEVAPPVETSDAAISADTMLPIAGAAGLGIVALAGFGMAMRRRRKDGHVVRDDWHEPAMTRQVAEPVAARPITATSGSVTPQAERPAFAWGNMAPVAAAAAPAAARNESRIEAAYRGPTPDNPFLSLKKRLRRAAFFDQRERAVRAGKAAPVSPMAGLPRALANGVRTAMAPRETRVLQPA